MTPFSFLIGAAFAGGSLNSAIFRFLSAARSGVPALTPGERARGVHVQPSTVVCTGAPGAARNRVKDVSRAAENSAFTELTVKFLELNHTNLHNYLKRLPSLHTYENDQDQAVRKSEHVHLARVPRCQRRHR